jgi:V8-like Glu-specific endopeptidase
MAIVALFLANGAVVASPALEEGPQSGQVESERIGPDADKSPLQPVSSGVLPELQALSWTREEMRDAIPIPLPEGLSERDLLEMGSELLSRVPVGPPVVISSKPPEASAPLSEELADSTMDTTPGVVAPLGYSYPFPFTRYEIFTTYQQFPYMTIGKIFFKGTDGKSYVCSGASAVGRAVWTAGHCVYNNASMSGRDGWHTNVVFVPGYRDGSTPYGQWTAKELWTLTGWQNNKQAYDIGMIVTNDQNGAKLSQRVGNLGALFNASRVQHWNDFGYPQAAPFNGNRLIVCLASHAKDDPKGSDPATIGIGCDMTGGCSGGPWVVGFSGQAGATNYVNGVNSYIYTSQPKALYSSFFGDGAKNLYDAVKNR